MLLNLWIILTSSRGQIWTPIEGQTATPNYSPGRPYPPRHGVGAGLAPQRHRSAEPSTGCSTAASSRSRTTTSFFSRRERFPSRSWACSIRTGASWRPRVRRKRRIRSFCAGIARTFSRGDDVCRAPSLRAADCQFALENKRRPWAPSPVAGEGGSRPSSFVHIGPPFSTRQNSPPARRGWSPCISTACQRRSGASS